MTDEQALIAALKQRDSAALEAVFAAHADRIYRLGMNLLHDEQQADNVVQDTFLTLIEHIDQFEGRSSLSTWLYRVGHNHCLTQLRRVRPNLELDSLDEPDIAPVNFTPWSAPEEMVFSSEIAGELERAIATLSPALRAVFVMRDIEEFATGETADILGISESAVKVRLHRARLLLREQLAPYFGEQFD
ncbi:MAG: RNA polymerase sigma factor [Anaerolineaceae bacterium]|nr:RNA polymerase sigma factor [Anaerolineaceae bacterium]